MAITINGDGLIEVGGTSTTQGRVRLAEDTDTGTNYIELTAPSSVTANRTITFPDATTTVVGTDTTQTLTNKTIDGSQLVAASVTSTQMATAVQPLGNGQTWQNVTGSRGYGTTYTNSTGRAIMVAIAGSNNTNASWAILTPTVGGVTLPDARAIVNQSYCFTTFIVPTGATYSVANSGTAMALQVWSELR